MGLAVWREERLAATRGVEKNDKGLDDGLHWLVWLYCHKRKKGRLKTWFLGFQTTFVLSGLNGFSDFLMRRIKTWRNSLPKK